MSCISRITGIDGTVINYDFDGKSIVPLANKLIELQATKLELPNTGKSADGKMPLNVFKLVTDNCKTFKGLTISLTDDIEWNGRGSGGDYESKLNGIAETDKETLDMLIAEYKKLEQSINNLIKPNLKPDATCVLTSYFRGK